MLVNTCIDTKDYRTYIGNEEEKIMHLHANAKLTMKQRQEIRRLHCENRISIRRLATQFQVSRATIEKWVHRESPCDVSSAPHHPRTVITAAYQTAVLEYRHEHPQHGPIRIAEAVRPSIPQAHRETIRRILLRAGVSVHAAANRPPRHPIPVGHHRVQMDIQQLPAIEGNTGFEYKISVIHLRTRMKYSEIHPDATSPTVAGVFRRACDRLPPFFL